MHCTLARGRALRAVLNPFFYSVGWDVGLGFEAEQSANEAAMPLASPFHFYWDGWGERQEPPLAPPSYFKPSRRGALGITRNGCCS